jgi:hypothetical protein
VGEHSRHREKEEKTDAFFVFASCKRRIRVNPKPKSNNSNNRTTAQPEKETTTTTSREESVAHSAVQQRSCRVEWSSTAFQELLIAARVKRASFHQEALCTSLNPLGIFDRCI